MSSNAAALILNSGLLKFPEDQDSLWLSEESKREAADIYDFYQTNRNTKANL